MNAIYRGVGVGVKVGTVGVLVDGGTCAVRVGTTSGIGVRLT